MSSFRDISTTLRNARLQRGLPFSELQMLADLGRHRALEVERGEGQATMAAVIAIADVLGFDLILVPRKPPGA